MVAIRATGFCSNRYISHSSPHHPMTTPNPRWHYPAPLSHSHAGHALNALYDAAHSSQHDDAYAILLEYINRSTYEAPTPIQQKPHSSVNENPIQANS